MAKPSPHTLETCTQCAQRPHESDPALSAGLCFYCGYLGVPAGAERDAIRGRNAWAARIGVEPMPPPTKDAGYNVKLSKDSPGPVRVNFTTRDGALLEVVLSPGESVSFSP